MVGAVLRDISEMELRAPSAAELHIGVPAALPRKRSSSGILPIGTFTKETVQQGRSPRTPASPMSYPPSGVAVPRPRSAFGGLLPGSSSGPAGPSTGDLSPTRMVAVLGVSPRRVSAFLCGGGGGFGVVNAAQT